MTLPPTHKGSLSSYANDRSIDAITIELNIKKETSDSELSVFADEKSQEPDQIKKKDTTDGQRDKRSIQSNTSHHRVLQTLSSLNDANGATPGREVRSRVAGVSESSVYPALTQLWERQLVTRERVEDVPNPYYKYEVSDHGKQTLEQLGKPDKPYITN